MNSNNRNVNERGTTSEKRYILPPDTKITHQTNICFFSPRRTRNRLSQQAFRARQNWEVTELKQRLAQFACSESDRNRLLTEENERLRGRLFQCEQKLRNLQATLSGVVNFMVESRDADDQGIPDKYLNCPLSPLAQADNNPLTGDNLPKDMLPQTLHFDLGLNDGEVDAISKVLPASLGSPSASICTTDGNIPISNVPASQPVERHLSSPAPDSSEPQTSRVTAVALVPAITEEFDDGVEMLPYHGYAYPEDSLLNQFFMPVSPIQPISYYPGTIRMSRYSEHIDAYEAVAVKSLQRRQDLLEKNRFATTYHLIAHILIGQTG
jgi:hypothetical protein